MAEMAIQAASSPACGGYAMSFEQDIIKTPQDRIDFEGAVASPRSTARLVALCFISLPSQTPNGSNAGAL